MVSVGRKTKIVCTIGPASSTRESLMGLVRGGMDVARLNFSHGDHASHRRAFRLIRECSEEAGRAVAVMQDLQGIKIRTGPAQGGAVELKRGGRVLIRPGVGMSTEGLIYVSYPGIVREAGRGQRVLLDDGLMELKVTGRERGALKAVVVEGGVLTDRKGVNLPGMAIKARAFTGKDRRDLALGLALGVDYVAVSFVRAASDVRSVKSFIRRAGRDVPVIAKIEKPEAVEDIEGILGEADGIMVARGDLGVEVPAEDVPMLQKALIEGANRRGRLVITATQMLESMTEHRSPTRAEATDVANAVLDGSDALMLSAETSKGRHPLLAVRMMDRIIRKTEGEMAERPAYLQGKSYSEAIAEAAAEAAGDIGARCVAAFTQSGYTAGLLSKFRPRVPIVAFTPSEAVRRRMALMRGVLPLQMRPLRSTDDVFMEVERALLKGGLVRAGESVAIVASTPIGGRGKTNLLKLHRVGEGPAAAR